MTKIQSPQISYKHITILHSIQWWVVQIKQTSVDRGWQNYYKGGGTSLTGLVLAGSLFQEGSKYFQLPKTLMHAMVKNRARIQTLIGTLWKLEGQVNSEE